MKILKTHSIYIFLFLLSIAVACKKDSPGAGVEADIIFSTEILRLDWEGGERTISVFSKFEWHLLPTDKNWIVVSKEDESLITVVADKNETQSDRVIKIPILCNGTRYNITVRQSALDYIDIKSEKSVVVDANGGQVECKVESNVRYEVTVGGDGEGWISMLKVGDGITSLKGGLTSQGIRPIFFNILANEGTDSRRATIYFEAKTSELRDSVVIIQNAAGQGEGTDIDGTALVDGVAYSLQKSKYDKLNLIVMGDGFLKSHLIAGGLYEKSMKQAIDAFFSIFPYTEFKDLFNLYIVGVESDSDVIGNKTGFGSSSKTRLGTAFGSGTEVVCDDDIVFEYASKAVSISDERNALIIVVLNSNKYAGTCYMYINGNAIALCPMSKENPPYDFESVVRHEAGGHGFGFLADEYVYYQSKLPSLDVQEMKEWQEYGFEMNLDFTSDLSSILWKDFVGLSGYPEVGAYEGGAMYQFGVWRSEENSCMNNNIPYYNIQSRWVIYRRIKQLANLPYSVSDFLSMDQQSKAERLPLSAPALGPIEFVPLASPKMFKY